MQEKRVHNKEKPWKIHDDEGPGIQQPKASQITHSQVPTSPNNPMNPIPITESKNQKSHLGKSNMYDEEDISHAYRNALAVQVENDGKWQDKSSITASKFHRMETQINVDKKLIEQLQQFNFKVKNKRINQEDQPVDQRKVIKALSSKFYIGQLIDSRIKEFRVKCFQKTNETENDLYNIYLLNDFEFVRAYFGADGSFYEGEINLENGKAEGYGFLVKKNGDFYKGQFKNGQKDGHGIEKYTNFYFEGNYLEDKKNGKGVLSYDGKLVYDGEFKNGVYDGCGIFHSTNGFIYDGFWQNNRKIGTFLINKEMPRNGYDNLIQIQKIKFEGKSDIGKGVCIQDGKIIEKIQIDSTNDKFSLNKGGCLCG